MSAIDEQVQTLNIEEKRVVAKPTEALANISLNESNPERCIKIGVDLEGKIKEDLIQFLKKNIDVFAWSHEDMPGIDPSVITHRLNVCPSFKFTDFVYLLDHIYKYDQYFDIFLTDQYNLHATHFFNSHQIHLSHDR